MEYLGKQKKSLEKLSKKLKVDVAEVEALKNNPIRYIVNDTTGDVAKINVNESPLLLREFGIKRINNKLVTGGNIKKGFTVSKEPISLETPITGMINCIVTVEWTSSGNKWNKEMFLPSEKRIINEIDFDFQEEIINEFFSMHREYKQTDKPENERWKRNEKLLVYYGKEWIVYIDNEETDIEHKPIINFITNNQQTLEFDDMVLRGEALDLTSIYGETIMLNDVGDDNCVKNYLLKAYPKIAAIKKMNDNGITPNELKQFCSNYRIKMILYDVSGNVVSQYLPETKNKSYKNLIGVCYNNHFYPMKNEYLHKIPKSDIKENIYSDNLHLKLIELLKNKVCPNNVQIYMDEIVSITCGNTVYHSNQDYDICFDILNKLGLGDKMTFMINTKNISKTIEKLFIKSSVDSFFPYMSNHTGYNYLNENFDNTKETATIDHNKHYSDALRKLTNLIKIDIRTAEHIENPTELKMGYFYIAKPRYSNILMETTGFYPYDYLKFCEKEKVQFELLEAISCEYTKNYYTEMIDTLYQKLSPENFKFVVNCMIGSFEKKSSEKTIKRFIKIANEDETKTTDKYVKRVNDTYNIIYDIIDVPNLDILNKVPIRVQVLCNARRIVYEKLKELKLKPVDIKQIRTDAITFHSSKKIKASDEIGGWKYQKSTLFKCVGEPVLIDVSFKLEPLNQTNTIYIDYAGSGKTYHIINNLIPTLDDYIVLSPSHASIREYRANKINCNVIHKYSFSNTVPTEKNIIIDEVGMLDTYHNNVIIKSAMMGKNIYSYGDFKQLKPVSGEPCCSSIYLNYIYGNITKLGTNHRNKFTFDYYDELFNMKDSKKMMMEIMKYNTKKYYDAETIITYKNETRKKYNELMCKKLNIKFGDVGCKIVCKTNDLKDKDVYNNFYYTIKAKGIITDGIDDIDITDEELKKHFDLGYCRTLYNIQGESLDSFYFTTEDINCMDGRALYTLISRLRG